MRRHALAVVFLAACARRPVPGPVVDTTDGAPAVADAAATIVDAAVPDVVAEPPLALASDGGLSALLAGDVPATKLPEQATDQGGVLDRQLRKRLTTVDLPYQGGLAGIGVPTGDVVLGGTSSTSPIADADRVVAGLRARLRRCYAMGLEADASMAGKLVVSATITKTGDVADAIVSSNAGISPSVASCVTGVVKRASFTAPASGSGASLTIPLRFGQAS